MNKSVKVNAELVLVNAKHFYNVPLDEVQPWYVSITTILRSLAKGVGFEKWLGGKSPEEVANILEEASLRGTKVHVAIDRLIKGEVVDPKEFEFITDKGLIEKGLNAEQSRMLSTFQRFWYENRPKVFTTEFVLYSTVHKFAGTCDFIGQIGEDFVILDWKTSSAIHTAYELQVGAYAAMFYEMFGKAAKKVGILRLGTRHKCGYELKWVENPSAAYRAFLGVYEAWKYENPNFAPKFIELPRAFKLPKVEHILLNPPVVVVEEERKEVASKKRVVKKDSKLEYKRAIQRPEVQEDSQGAREEESGQTGSSNSSVEISQKQLTIIKKD